jgi:hypothetical protein
MTEFAALFLVAGLMFVFLALIILVGNALTNTRNISNRAAGGTGILGCVLLAIAVLL